MRYSRRPPNVDRLPPPRPLSDDEIYAIAMQIRDAVRAHERNALEPGILSLRYELPPDDEDRVISALAVLDLLDSASR